MSSPKDLLSKTILLEIPPDLLTHGRQSRSPRGSGTRSPAAAVIGSADIKVLFDNVYDAALITDLSGIILDANPRASFAFDFTHKEFCERNISSIILGFNDEVMTMVCDNLTNDRFTLIQASCLRKDASEFPAEVSTSRMRIPGRDFLCFFIRDITARREAEEQIQRAHDELASEVRERTKLNEELNAEIAVRTTAEKKLQHAIITLQKHDLAKTEFVSNVSHELKTPLASINYVAGNLLKGIAGPVSSQATDYLGMIRADCQRLTRTVEDILDMSRIEAKTLSLRCVKIHFPLFLRNAVESLRIQIEAAGLTLSLEIEDSHLFVNGDPQKLERVIFNIIRNAIKFNVPQGTVDVRLKQDPGMPGYLLLEIIDSGIGIEARHLKSVTDRFFRVGEHVSGAGLGVAICKELIEHHGGTIELLSPPPQQTRGTCVGIRLPIITPPFVLVMGDEDTIRDQVEKRMMAYGYDARSIDMNADVDQQVAVRKPDIIVLGWTAPGLEPARLLSVLRSSDLLRTIPLLFISSGAENPVKQEILRGVGAPILTAPWNEKDLFRRLEQAVMGKKT
jgi:PAS domain S-box-containing protein